MLDKRQEQLNLQILIRYCVQLLSRQLTRDCKFEKDKYRY